MKLKLHIYSNDEGIDLQLDLWLNRSDNREWLAENIEALIAERMGDYDVIDITANLKPETSFVKL